MLADFDAKYRQHLRSFFFGKTSRDTDVSNPPRSASQSAISTLCLGAESRRDHIDLRSRRFLSMIILKLPVYPTH
jgi:hypothetical protein